MLYKTPDEEPRPEQLCLRGRFQWPPSHRQKPFYGGREVSGGISTAIMETGLFLLRPEATVELNLPLSPNRLEISKLNRGSRSQAAIGS